VAGYPTWESAPVFDPAAGRDDVFGVGKPVGAVGLRTSGGLVRVYIVMTVFP
jgi:hypothetical protein